MIKIGIIAGLGPESTVDYYKEIIAPFNSELKEFAYPEILVYSANINQLTRFVEAEDWASLTKWLLEKINAIHKTGAGFAAIASNTPHIVFQQLQEMSPIPLVSIVDETVRMALKQNIRKVGLLGTKLTMTSDFFKEPFENNGIQVFTPNNEEINYIHHKLFSEIEFGIFKESTRNGLLKIIERIKDENKIDAIVLGCTELPLILTEEAFGLKFLNTTKIHCEGILGYYLNKISSSPKG